MTANQTEMDTKELLFSEDETLALYSLIRTYLLEHPYSQIQDDDGAEREYQVVLRNLHRRIANYIGWPGLERRAPFDND